MRGIMKKKFFNWNMSCAAVTVIFIVIFYACGSYAQSPNPNISTVIAFVSDTQEPMMIEKLWLKSDNNELATKAVFQAIGKEEHLSALFHLGDITAMGFWPWEWDGISGEFSALRKSGISVWPELGNHEYFLFSSLGQKQFFKHFPQVHSSWYVKLTGDVAVILLNSNFSDLSDNEISTQQKWYEKTLRELDGNSSVRYVIVGTHYPPYTNSKVVEPSSDVQRMFVPAFLKSRKCRLFLSGHSHSLEHFQNEGKDFLVLGGGGGLLHPLLTGKDARYKDLCTMRSRTFHYVTCEEKGDSMVVKVKMLNKDYRGFRDAYRIGIGK